MWALGVFAVCLFVWHSKMMATKRSFHSLVPIGLAISVGTVCTLVDVYILWYYDVL